MPKKLSLLLASLLSAPAMAQVKVYGVADIFMARENNGQASALVMNSGGLSSSRVGFKGEEDLGSGLKVFFKLEHGFELDTGEMTKDNVLFNRQSHVGIASESLGKFAMGLQSTGINSVYTEGDPFDLTDFSPADVFKTQIDKKIAISSRESNMLSYASPDMGGLTVGLQYVPSEVAAAGYNKEGQITDVSASYAQGPFYVGAAQASEWMEAGIKSTVTAFATAYDAGYAKFYANYASGRYRVAGLEDERANAAQIGLRVPVSAAGAVLASVGRERVAGQASAGATAYALGYDHVLSKRTDLYAAYSAVRNNADARYGNLTNFDMPDDGVSGEDPTTLLFGLRHRF